MSVINCKLHAPAAVLRVISSSSSSLSSSYSTCGTGFDLCELFFLAVCDFGGAAERCRRPELGRRPFSWRSRSLAMDRGHAPRTVPLPADIRHCASRRARASELAEFFM